MWFLYQATGGAGVVETKRRSLKLEQWTCPSSVRRSPCWRAQSKVSEQKKAWHQMRTKRVRNRAEISFNFVWHCFVASKWFERPFCWLHGVFGWCTVCFASWLLGLRPIHNHLFLARSTTVADECDPLFEGESRCCSRKQNSEKCVAWNTFAWLQIFLIHFMILLDQPFPNNYQCLIMSYNVCIIILWSKTIWGCSGAQDLIGSIAHRKPQLQRRRERAQFRARSSPFLKAPAGVEVLSWERPISSNCNTSRFWIPVAPSCETGGFC